MLGIIIGISSVIAVVALGQGSKAMMNKEFEKLGVNRASIYHNWREDHTSRDYMNHEDIKALRRSFEDDIAAMSPTFSVRGKVVAGREKRDVYIYGAGHEYINIDKKEIIKGRYLVEGDIKAKRNVVVIDDELALEIFGRTNVIGERIIVNNNANNYSPIIVGVYKNKKSILMGGMSGNAPKFIYLPISTVEKMFGIGDRIYELELNLKQGVNIEQTLDKMVKLIERRHDNVGKNKYRSYNAESDLEMVNKMAGVMTMVVGAIAAISLLVGGIGVMNIMLVSVTERTREIGIRKAIGARHRDILFQFLVEAVIISGIGGIIGTILGVGLSYIISNFIKIPPTVSPLTILIAWVFSAGVGIFFGIYPANKAAKLDPIEALRYE